MPPQPGVGVKDRGSRKILGWRPPMPDREYVRLPSHRRHGQTGRRCGGTKHNGLHQIHEAGSSSAGFRHSYFAGDATNGRTCPPRHVTPTSRLYGDLQLRSPYCRHSRSESASAGNSPKRQASLPASPRARFALRPAGPGGRARTPDQGEPSMPTVRFASASCVPTPRHRPDDR